MNEWRHKIINLYTNNKGKYLRGWGNSKTPEDLLNAMNIPWNGSRDEKIYRKAQSELNRFCVDLLDKGYIAGGISSRPTHYTIAENEKEIKMIFCNRKNQVIGRIKNLMKRGKDLISLQAPQKLIEDLINVE